MRVKYIFLFCVFSFLFGNTQNIDVTFMVDMQYETVSADGVYLTGSMQSWIPSSTQMLDGDGDGVYEVTLTLNVNSSYEYKFINGNAWGYDEILASWEGCSAGNGNRLLVTSTVNQILPAYIFNSCNVVTFYGCTDSLALNYDVLATNNDGSCLYCQATIIDSISTNFSCPGDTIFIYGDSLCSPMKVHLQGWTIPDSLVLSSTLNEVVWIFPG